MERTALREQFFAEVHRDPYTHAITNLWAEAWVAGYEAAVRAFAKELKAAGEERAAMDSWEHFHERSRSQWRDVALAVLTDQRGKSEAELVVAMADLGKLAPTVPHAGD